MQEVVGSSPSGSTRVTRQSTRACGLFITPNGLYWSREFETPRISRHRLTAVAISGPGVPSGPVYTADSVRATLWRTERGWIRLFWD